MTGCMRHDLQRRDEKLSLAERGSACWGHATWWTVVLSFDSSEHAWQDLTGGL